MSHSESITLRLAIAGLLLLRWDEVQIAESHYLLISAKMILITALVSVCVHIALARAGSVESLRRSISFNLVTIVIAVILSFESQFFSALHKPAYVLLVFCYSGALTLIFALTRHDQRWRQALILVAGFILSFGLYYFIRLKSGLYVFVLTYRDNSSLLMHVLGLLLVINATLLWLRNIPNKKGES